MKVFEKKEAREKALAEIKAMDPEDRGVLAELLAEADPAAVPKGFPLFETLVADVQLIKSAILPKKDKKKEPGIIDRFLGE